MCLVICFDSVFLFVAQEMVDDAKVEGVSIGGGGGLRTGPPPWYRPQILEQ